MKTAFPASLLVFVLVLGVLTPAVAAPADGDDEARFFVQTTKGFWKNTLGVRHAFEDGFTTEAVGLQLQLAKIMGVKVYPVHKLNILQGPPEVVQAALPDQAAEPAKKPESPGKPDNPEPTPEPRVIPSEQIPWGVSMVYGESGVVPSGGTDVHVAVLDTGIAEHPDLDRRIADCRDFSQRKQPMIEGSCEDSNGHGTHVAGIIAADGGEDGAGIYGVAPGADLFIYKVCGRNGSCWSDDIAVAIRTAADVGANVVNLSLGADARSSLIADAVSYARSQGVLVVAAAGNDGPYPDSIDYPAGLVDVVAVGALDVQYEVTEWSSRGLNETTEPFVVEERDIEIVAPGENIESASRDGAYAILSGTSMASPHVAGLAALLWQFSDEEGADEAGLTRGVLQSAAIDILPAGDDGASGFGLPIMPLPATE